MIFETSWRLPSQLKSEAERFFTDEALRNAVQFLGDNKVSLSFQKGSPETYFIASGIVKEDRNHEAKVVYKKRLEDTEESPLTSQCDCHRWSLEKNCDHTAALFLLYYLQDPENSKYLGEFDQAPNFNFQSNIGASVDRYGTIINNPHQLRGSHGHSTYSSIQYLLTNNQVVSFPIPGKFEGKLKISIYPSIKQQEDARPEELIHFSWIHENGEEEKKISLFESLYIFNWVTGECYHLPPEIKDLIQRIRHRGYWLEVDEILRLSKKAEVRDWIDLHLDGFSLQEMKLVAPVFFLKVEPSERKNLLQVQIHATDDTEKVYPLPEIFTGFSYSDNLLGLFRRKKDAYEFIQKLSDYFLDGKDDFRKMFNTGESKKRWIEVIDELKDGGKLFHYDAKSRSLISYDATTVVLLYNSLVQRFGSMSFRYANYSKEEHSLSLEVGTNIFYDGVSEFYRTLSPFGLQVYYNKQELARWNKRIRFERRSSTTKWFDLELTIGDDDLEILIKADLNTGVVLTKKGLVLLTPEQKELIRFMKKYTAYEGKKIEPGDQQRENGNEGENKFVLPFQRARIFELFELKRLGIEGALTPEEEELCEKLRSFDEMPEYELKEHYEKTLRPYQKQGYQWLRFLHENKLGACLADDMGLGKTLQAIAFIDSIIDQVDSILIVCPVSLLLNWEKEFQKFSDIEIAIYHGGDRSFPKDKKVILTSYGVMKRDVDEVFADKNFDLFILDEVQHLKNIRSMGSFAARRINADFRICLTGTPVENDLAEFYNILDLSIPGIWGDLQFVRTTSNSKSRLIARKTAAPFILRRTKSQVLNDLPEKIENNVILNFSDHERQYYQKQLINIRLNIQNAPSRKKYGEILKGLLELRQRCLWQQSQPSSEALTGGVESVKIRFLCETLEQIIEEGHKAIVFSQFTTYLDLIQNILEKKHYRLSRIDGSQSIKRRQKEVDQFQEGKSQVFLISLKAGGVGLNLTAASYVFLMDPWWNPAVEAQAIDRAHRIGQKHQLTVYRPVIKDTVEEKVIQLQEMKRELFRELLPDDDDAYFTGKLTMKDFEQLFE